MQAFISTANRCKTPGSVFWFYGHTQLVFDDCPLTVCKSYEAAVLNRHQWHIDFEYGGSLRGGGVDEAATENFSQIIKFYQFSLSCSLKTIVAGFDVIVILDSNFESY